MNAARARFALRAALQQPAGNCAVRSATRLDLCSAGSVNGARPQNRSYFAGRIADSARAATWRRRAGQLYSALESDPNNPHRFAEYLRALNHFDPQQVIRRFEQQDPNAALANDGAVREYIRALVLANRLDYVDLKMVLGRVPQTMAHSGVAQAAATGATMTATAGQAGAPVEMKFPDSKPLKVQISDTNRQAFWKLLRTSIIVLILVAGASVFAETLAGNAQKGMGGMGGMGSSKKITPVEGITTGFNDVKGCDEVRGELEEIVMYLKDPDRFTRLGAKLPKGVLMSGAPGTGKTLLARAIAGEAGVPFLQASGAEFEEMFVGVGARRIRDLFGEARKHAPCIIFIDEIDAVGSKRSMRDNSANRMTLNQLLVELDGFEQNNGIVVICATNFAESLDKALTRPGRLDKQVVVPVPDLKGRMEILELYCQKIVLGESVDLWTLARRTAGMTGADLFNILNIAAVRSSADNLERVTMSYLEEAFDRVVVGLERKNPMSDHEKKLTAYHEGGHTLVSMGFEEGQTDPVHKATIMPRGNALGVTWNIPEREKYSTRMCEMQARLEVLMGGKAAEELIFGTENVTSGCTSDLQQATSLARKMVMNYGMAEDSAPLFLDLDEYAALSDEAKHKIDTKTQSLLTRSYTAAYDHLKKNEKKLHLLADALVEYETLGLEEIKMAIDGKAEDIGMQRVIREMTEKTIESKGAASTGSPRPQKSKKSVTENPRTAVEDAGEGAE